ncbi:MAG: DUF72 domain-containing protein [Phycisphaeraceae bacterium]|nr:DUF72 domain-containing protein [Phycisphaeraceae bacterium]
MANARSYVGTSGWNYDHWKEVFYPGTITQDEWFNHYAGRFDTTEVDRSFHQVPEPDTVERWLEQTPADFRLTLQLWRGVTHMKRLKASLGFLRRFMKVAEALPTRQRGPILAKIPGDLPRDDDRLRDFLEAFKEASGDSRWKLAVEFRHDSWLDKDVTRLLDRFRVARVMHDHPGGGAVGEPNDSSFIYIRCHGPGRYGKELTGRLARRVNGFLSGGRSCFVYFNNHREGYAIKDAQRLRDLTGG